MSIKLGINTGFALNRFPTPEEWIPLVGNIFGIKIVQFTADLLNPSLPDKIINNNIARIRSLAKEHLIAIDHTFTGAFTRVNHLAHPDNNIRLYWIDWFKRFLDISAELGAKDMGSHLAILSYQDNKNKEKRAEMLNKVVDGWHEIAVYAKQKGLEYLTWEPMSISREFGETIEEARLIDKLLNKNAALPIKFCLDVDHGDVMSINPDDTNPYKWLEEFAEKSPIIHIKQSLLNKGGHWPFISEYNSQGKIEPVKIFDVLKNKKVKDVILLLELSFREREPFESRVIEDIKLSAEYWKSFDFIE